MPPQQQIVVRQRESAQAELGGIVISAVKTSLDDAKVVVGWPGLPNVQETLGVGGALLYETPEGLYEVRLMTTNSYQIEVLLTLISPRPGFAAGFFDSDPNNTPFTTIELERIASSLEGIRSVMGKRTDITHEKLDFISRKLDEMQAAAERLGRKDWMNLAIGTLTSIIVTAALESSAAKALLQAASAALSWVFGSNIILLP